MTKSEPNFPLAGIRVLDMSRVLSGPFAGRMLSDLGADVVKLEPPEGDVTRLWGKKIAGISGYFAQQNAGKRDISIDLRQAKGVELAKCLVEKADILIENFRPDVMPRLGLAYETLAAINPRLIMLSISGFGAGNADSKRAAYAPVVHAELGFVHGQSELSGAYPTDITLSAADTNASLHGLVGVLSALYVRASTGEGQHIDMAMVDASMYTNDGMTYALEEPSQSLPNEVIETSAGKLMLAGDFRFIWQRLSERCGVDDGLSPGATLDQKIEARRAAAHRFFNETCADRESVIAALAQMNVAWGDVRTATQAAELPSVKSRGVVAQVDDRDGGMRPAIQAPYRFSQSHAAVRGGAPHLGEHNTEVLKEWLAMSPAEMGEFAEVLVGKSGN